MRKEYSHVRSSSKIFWRARVSMISRKEKRSCTLFCVTSLTRSLRRKSDRSQPSLLSFWMAMRTGMRLTPYSSARRASVR